MLNNVPLTGQTLNQTRNPINQNFSVIDTAFSVDHVPYNEPSGNQGQHNKVTFPVQSPAPNFPAGDLGLFNATFPPTSVNELFVRKDSGTAYPMTSSNNSSVNGWTYLPSGLLLQWGVSTVTTFTVVFDRPFASVYNAQIAIFDPTGTTGNTSVITALSNTQISAKSTFNGQKYWMVIGLGNGI